MDSPSSPKNPASPARAVLFIDGSNWYHRLKKIGIDSGALDYQRVAKKLLAGRELHGIRYYVGKVTISRKQIAAQAKFLKLLRAQNVQVHLGRIEKNWMSPRRNPNIQALRAILAEEKSSVPAELMDKLSRLCSRDIPYYVEKQVDVRIAVDLVRMAHRDEYDVAYLLSADGDFVPAVKAVRDIGKTVFAANPSGSLQIGAAVNAFIPLQKEWFPAAAATKS